MSASRPDNCLFLKESPDGEVTYFICQTEGHLTEEIFEDGWDAPLPVGDAKEGTGGCYLLFGEDQDKRVIYCQGSDNILTDFIFDPDDWEWEGGSLAQFGVQAAPESGLAALYRPDEKSIEVVFESVSGKLQSVCGGGGRPWKISTGFPDTEPVSGTSIDSLLLADGPHVFYAHADLSVHELFLDGDSWIDTSITATSGSLPRREIHARPAENGGGYVLEYSDDSGGLYIFPDDNNAAVEVGFITNDGVKLKKDAENTRFGTTFNSKLQWGRSK